MNTRRTSSKDIRGVKLGIHGVRLACVNHEEYFVISFGHELVIIFEFEN